MWTENSGAFVMQKINDSLPGRILSVILATLSAAVLVYLFASIYDDVYPHLLKWVLLFTLGISAGLVSRLLLQGHVAMLQWLISLLGLLVGLVFLGFLSQGDLGARLPVSDPGRLNSTWLPQFGAAAAAALLPLFAWRGVSSKRIKTKDQPRITRPAAGPETQKPPIFRQKKIRPGRRPNQPIDAVRKNKPLQVTQRLFWEKRWKKIQEQARHWWKHGIPDLHLPETVVQKPGKKKPAVQVQVKRKPRRLPSRPNTQTNVHLIGKEEHRCPYCLEVVTTKDPRGVKICPICHTHHHADCWAVTGTCQVPHFHQ